MKLLLAILLLVSSHAPFWHYNEHSNEMEYWVYDAGYHTCGFVSYSAPGEAGIGVPAGFMVDVLGSGGARESYSKWFNTMDDAERSVAAGCGNRRRR